MTLRLYIDHNVPKAITVGLRLRNVDVLTAFEDKANEFDDSTLLTRATEIDRTLFTFDDDLLDEAAKRQNAFIDFAGVIYAHQLNVSIGRCVQDLELIAKATEPEDLKNSVIFLPI